MRSAAPWVIVALVAAVPFISALGAEFLVYDDPMMIAENLGLWSHNGSGLAEFWRRPFFEIYAPITFSTLWLLAHFDTALGLPTPDARVFHAASLLLHAANATLVYGLIRRQGIGRWATAAGALVFAWHPLQVESVAWASEIKTQLAGVFGLTAIALYGFFPPSCRVPDWLRYVAATACFLAALGAKPTAAIVPLLALVMESPGPRHWKRTVLRLGPWLLAAAALVAATASEQSGELIRQSVAPIWRPLIAADSSACYLANVLYPWDLVPDYGRTPATALNDGGLYWTWIAPVGVLAILLTVRPLAFLRRPILWSAIALLPNCGLIPFLFQDISTVADRYAHVALVGIAWAVAELLTRIPARAALPMTLVVLAGLASLAARQTTLWHDDSQLFAHTLAVNPRSSLALVNLGLIELRDGHRAEAALKFQRAMQWNPRDEVALYNLGVLAHQVGHLEDAERLYHRSLSAGRGRLPVVAENLAALQLGGQRCDDAWQVIREALARWPRRGRLLVLAAQAKLGLGHRETSLRFVEQAIEVGFDDAEVLGSAADVAYELGDFALAADTYRRSLRLQPNRSEVAGSLAWLLSTCDDPRLRDGPSAIGFAESAVRSASKPLPEHLGTLAAALAEAGRWAEAVSTQQQAINLAKDQRRDDFTPAAEIRMQAYRAKQPWREPSRTSHGP